MESRISLIAVELILTAELQYRDDEIDGYKWRVERRAELEEKERQRKIASERAERDRKKRLEQARIDRLLTDAASFQKAAEIRKYVEALRSVQGSNDISSREGFEQWSQWALAQADRIDPAIDMGFLDAMHDEKDS